MSIITSISKFIPFINRELDFDSVTTLRIKRLFRFTSFDTDNNYIDLLKNILYFPSKSQLNDPFDSSAPARFDLCTEKELNKYLQDILASRSDDRLEREQKLNEALNRLKQNPQAIQDKIDNDLEKRAGILSFSTSLENLLLWAHYTNKHTGFCIEFDAQLLQAIMVHEFMKNKELAFLLKVKYQAKFPIIIPCRHSYEQKMKLQFLIKSKDWDYENEWRILLLNRSKAKVEIPNNIIKNIYFGLNASEENIKISVEVLKKSNPGVGLYKAVKKRDTFGLDFTKFNL